MGRRSKLTPERQQKIVSALRAGNYFDAACQYAGVTPQTGYNWIASGREAKSGMYFDFFEAVEKASADAEIETVAMIRKAIPDTWQAGAWWLERRFPKKWGRHVQELKLDDWRSQAIADIKAGNIRYEDLASAFDSGLAAELFAAAGLSVQISENTAINAG